MKFDKLTINNFRQYYKDVVFDFSTQNEKNIILIGGKNGYGKTNLLLSLVWCLYGEKISLVDENFKKEIQKEKNYQQFMKQSLNWDAAKESQKTFFVQLQVNDLELYDVISSGQNLTNIIIKREFEIFSMTEKLSITNLINGKELFDDEYEKITFINDFVIPLDAAKFVFFDAEKIAAMAELTTKEEGHVLNDALGKVLGLDLYEDLIEDLKFYSQSLKRDGAKGNINEQILDKEDTIKRELQNIEEIEEQNAEILGDIEKLRANVRSYDNFITQHSNTSFSKDDRESLLLEQSKTRESLIILDDRINYLGEIVPLAILSSFLEDVSEHLKSQDQINNIVSNEDISSSKVELLIERLFNQPPEPKDSSFTLKDKMFYYDKAMTICQELFQQADDEISLPFEHDLNNNEKALISNSLALVNLQSKDVFELAFQNFNNQKVKLEELNSTINRMDSEMEDELVIEYLTKREKSERQISDFNQQLGVNKEKIDKINKTINRTNIEYKSLLEKIDVTQSNKTKMLMTKEYIRTLQLFIDAQKELKKEALAKNILFEMRKLMHKLNTSENQFVSDVKVTILADGGGLKITLYNLEDQEIKKEVLSQGEKQIYISSLIKAILKESLQSLPIFIDTPLGRLDDEHIKNTLLYYYPDLSEQVIILSTNNEITPRRLNDINKYVSRTYLLESNGANTTVKDGYFKMTKYND